MVDFRHLFCSWRTWPGAIDAGIKNYFAKYHSTRMIQWLHASFGVGITSGPIIMTVGINITTHWQSGFFVISIAMGIHAAIFLFSNNNSGKFTEY